MKKVNIANYVIYDLANRFNNSSSLGVDSEVIDFVAETWCKKHFVSSSRGIKQYHNDYSQKFII